MGARPKFDWDSIKALFIAGKTSRELSIVFGVSDDAIRQRSRKGGWMALRKKANSVSTPPQFVTLPVKDSKNTKNRDDSIGFGKQSLILASEEKRDVSFERALKLRSSDNFRERVIKQADKAMDTLEKAVLNNVFETDRFAEALTKVERIGARAYGYDREGDRPVINIGILGSGSEYDPVN